MQDQLTDHLDQQLKSTSLENFSDYLKNLQQLPSLQDFFSVYIAKHDLKISQIIKNSGISQSYAHEILNGTKPHPSRDYLLALCLGAHMDLKTTVSWGSHGSENDAACSSDRSVRRTLCKSPKGCSDHDAYQ